MYPINNLVNSLIAEMLAGRNMILQELQQFRKNPTTIVPYLKQRISRYKQFQGSWFLFSKKYRKKAIEVHQKSRVDDRIRQLIGVLLGETQKMSVLETVPKLDEIASKLCQTIVPQINNQIQFKPQTSKVLRQLLEQDRHIEYPNSVVCLISIGFDEPLECLGNLLIDDGVLSRSNRRALLNPTMKYVGVASMKSPTEKQIRCSIIVLTDYIVYKNDHPAIINSSSNTQQVSATNINHTGADQSGNNHLLNSSSSSPISNNLRPSYQSMQTGRFPSEVKNIPGDTHTFHQTNKAPTDSQEIKSRQLNSDKFPSNPAPNYQSFGNNQNPKVPNLQKNISVNTIQSNQMSPKRNPPLNKQPDTILSSQNIGREQSLQFKETPKIENNNGHYPFSGIVFSNSQSISDRNMIANQNQKIKVNIDNVNSTNQYMNYSIDPTKQAFHNQNNIQYTNANQMIIKPTSNSQFTNS